jgi:hypothetical protein
LGEGCFDRHLHEASAHDGPVDAIVDGSIGERMFDADVIAFWASRSILLRASSSSRGSPLNPRIRGGTSICHGTESSGAGEGGQTIQLDADEEGNIDPDSFIGPVPGFDDDQGRFGRRSNRLDIYYSRICPKSHSISF